MREYQLASIGMSVVLACVLSIGLMSPGLVLADQDKVDVCHSEGDGTYHLITIPDPAYPTHVAHGDAGVGEDVPGMSGFVFDEDCIPVESVSCPCEGLESDGVFFDDSFSSDSCVNLTQFNSFEVVQDNPFGFLRAQFNVIQGYSCMLLEDIDAIQLFITADEYAACAALIIQIAANDGVTCQQF